ncbi:MAG: RNA-guided endonuclease InsQ/TnpB family protein [Halanaerobiales bacterium]
MGIIHRSLKIRIYPNNEQKTQINKTLGSCRALYNMMLYERMQIYEQLKDNRQKLYTYKYKTEKQYKEEFKWLKEADGVALQQSRIDLKNAYANFYRGLKKKQNIGFPKFKKKKNGSSYRTLNNNNGNSISIDFENKKIKLPKLGQIKFRDKRNNFNGKLKSATVSKTPTGKYFISLLFEQELYLKGNIIDNSLKTKTIGLDMSLEKFFVDNDGNSPAYEQLYRNLEPQLKKEQRRLSKKKRYSNNWYKQLYRVNLIHEKIKNKRKDFTHKLSKSIMDNNQVIVVENLSLQGMAQALNFGKSVMDLGYSEFVRQLEYKALENNKIFIRADKWFASSKTCSFCGFKNSDLKLSDREWRCPNCGTVLNRDENAGKNLYRYGLENIGLV